MAKKNSVKLKYVMTVPSVNFLNYISIKDLILLGSKDQRYQDLKALNSVLKRYLDSFKTVFGKKFNPSIVLRDESLPKVEPSYLCAFRNAIAIAGVIKSRAYSCLNNSQTTGFYCTDLFDFHPVSVSNDGTDLIAMTPFENGICYKVDNFNGQTTPSVIHPENITPIFDDKLMIALLDVVENNSRTLNKKEFKTKVVRSMEMAYYALRNPFLILGGQPDFGVQMSMWVSAFEVLANPYNDAGVHFTDVSAMIKAVPWMDKKLRLKKYAAVGSHRGHKATLPVQIYDRLYRTRNAYMHGNKMRKGEYEFHKRKGWGNLFFQIPALYRCVLMQLLNSNGFGELLVNSQEHKLYEKLLLSK